jgi:hypothetical protein
MVRSFDVFINDWRTHNICKVQKKCFLWCKIFNTNARSCNGDVLMNLNVLDAWYNGIDNTIYVGSCVNIC